MEYQFSKDFLWGAACSGPQSEGSFPGDGKAEMGLLVSAGPGVVLRRCGTSRDFGFLP